MILQALMSKYISSFLFLKKERERKETAPTDEEQDKNKHLVLTMSQVVFKMLYIH